MRIALDTNSVESYKLFLAIKALPKYRFVGREAIIPDEYADRLGIVPMAESHAEYSPLPGLFDYQGAISRLAIRKRKFAIFADCGLGKTMMMLEWIRHAIQELPRDKCGLIVSPLMVVRQTIAEAKRFYGDDLAIEHVKAKDLRGWLESGAGRIGVTNYEALTDNLPQGRLGALALDESSMLKSAYGKWGQACIRLGKGLGWKLALTGTPAPNDRIEFANHAVFLDAFPTVNSFLAKFFVNRGQTDNRWELKPHALKPFYRALSHWSIFLTNPGTYGWKDNAGDIPPIHTHIHEVDLTAEQQKLAYTTTGRMFADKIGGITSRSVLSQIAKGNHKGKAIATYKNAYIRALVDSWPDESSIIWCHYNPEQAAISKTFPDAVNIDGSTPFEKRMTLLDEFQSAAKRTLVSKGKVLGLGLNLQIATRHVFSGLQDSYETFYQCIKRSNRYGSTRDLNVHLPITDIERPMIETVLRKADRVQADCVEQERIFKECGYVNI